MNTKDSMHPHVQNLVTKKATTIPIVIIKEKTYEAMLITTNNGKNATMTQ